MKFFRRIASGDMPVSRAATGRIVTIGGLASAGRPHPVQQAFIDEQAFQCGYCLNGWVLTAKALLDTNPKPTDNDVWLAVGIAVALSFVLLVGKGFYLSLLAPAVVFRK